MRELISKSSKFIRAALCLVLALLANNAKAASSYWDIDGANPGAGGTTPSGSWEGAFWSTDSTGSSATTTWNDGDFPIFAADGATGSYTVTADAPHTIAGMQMQTSAGTVTINGTGILSISAGIQGFFSSGTLQINSVLGGTGGYEGQSGTVQLYGPNTYSGGSELNGNQTYFNNNNSFGSGPITPVFVAATPPGYSAVLSSGGALITLPNNFVISTANAGINFASGASTPVTCTGNWDLQNTLYLRNNGNNTAPLTLSGILSGVGGLTVSANNSGTILLSGANNYSGGTSLILGTTGVTLQLGNASALGSGATTMVGGCALDLNGNSVTAALTVNGTGFNNTGALINNSGTPASLSAGSTVSMGSVGQNDIGGSGDMTVNCGITSLANQAFAKVGTGTLTLNAANSFGTGQFFLGGGAGAGTVAIGNASAFGSGTLNINTAPATVRSASATSYSVSNPLTLGASGTLPGPHIIIGAPGTGNLTFTGNANTGGTADKTIQANGITVTFSGVISGNGATKTLGWAGANGGVIVLSGANTYQKINNLYSGTVQMAHSEVSGTSGPLGAKNTAGFLVFSGGTLQYSSANQFDYSGRFSTAVANQAYNIDVNGQAVTFATALTSSGGTLTLSDTAGGGTLTLTKVNTYAGGTTINAGTLDVSSTGSIAGNITVNGGVLKLDNTTALASGATLTLPGSPSASQVNLNLSGGTQNISALYFGTTQMAAGTWGASGAQHNNAAFIGNGLLNVASGPQPTIAITSITPNPVCSGSTVSLTATVSGGNSPSGTVQFFNGATSLGTQPLSSGTATLTGVNLPAGTYANLTAQYVGDNFNNSATSAAASPPLVVNALPTVTISPSGSTTLCSGSSVGLTASGASTYTWSPGTGLSATTGASVTANPTTTTAYTVTGTDGNGCQNTAMVTVTVQDCAPPNITNVVQNLDGSFSMMCTGVLSTPYVLKATSDVTTPKPWTTLQSGSISASPFTLTDGPSGLPQQRFYYLTNNAN
jgi:autotransporter-associated beta strand protein